MKKNFMKVAVKEAFDGLRKNHGGPFGAVIVKDGKIVAKAHNTVIKNNDPTAHAEISVIRKAAKKMKNFDLAGCILYTTCEPCPMCYAAIKWARINCVYFGCTKKDAAEIGFDDDVFYEDIKRVLNGEIKTGEQMNREICLEPFDEWKRKEDKTLY